MPNELEVARQILAAIPALAAHDSRDARIERLGGLTNLVYRVQMDGALYCLRIPGKGTEEYIDREVEAHNAQVAASAGVSPKVVHCDPESGVLVTALISDYVGGELLLDFLGRRRGKRLPAFEALHLVHALASGLEPIHDQREYHGDIHDENVLVWRRGVRFEVRLLDFFQRGRPDRMKIAEDVIQVIRLFYDALGGQVHYAAQPAEVKTICCGLRHDLIQRKFPTAHHLRAHLETFEWGSTTG